MKIKRNNILNRLYVLLNCAKPYLISSRKPKWCFLFFTRGCNLNCSYCCSAEEGTQKDISINEWTKIVDKLADLGIRSINITGGEPLMRKDVFELISHIRDKGMFPLMHSNFSLLNKPSIDKLADSGLLAIYASADSMDGFGKVCSKKIIEHLEYASTKGITPLVSSVVTAKNIDHIYELAKFVTERGILFCPGLYQPVGGVYSKRNDDLIPNVNSLKHFADKMIDLKKEHGRVVISYSFLKNIDKYPDGWKCSPDEDYWLTINNDGTLMPCQEYLSEVSILDIEDLSDPTWRSRKKEIVESCNGCYHHCYYQQESLRGMELFKEYRTGMYLLKRLK